MEVGMFSYHCLVPLATKIFNSLPTSSWLEPHCLQNFNRRSVPLRLLGTFWSRWLFVGFHWEITTYHCTLYECGDCKPPVRGSPLRILTTWDSAPAKLRMRIWGEWLPEITPCSFSLSQGQRTSLNNNRTIFPSKCNLPHNVQESRVHWAKC